MQGEIGAAGVGCVACMQAGAQWMAAALAEASQEAAWIAASCQAVREGLQILLAVLASDQARRGLVAAMEIGAAAVASDPAVLPSIGVEVRPLSAAEMEQRVSGMDVVLGVREEWALVVLDAAAARAGTGGERAAARARGSRGRKVEKEKDLIRRR